MLSSAVVLATALFLLPVLLSLGPVVQSSLNLLNQELAGTLQVQSCSIGWQQGLHCQGLRYEYPRQGLRLETPGLSSDKGLLGLLAAPRYLGTFTLDQPVLTLSPPGKEGEQPSDVHDRKLTSVRIPGSGKPWWERAALRLAVNHGTVLVDSGDASSRSLATEVQLKGRLADGIVNYALDFLSGLDQEGSLRVEGYINLPPSWESLGETLISRAEMEIRGMDIAPFLELTASWSGLPQGLGRLHASCSLHTSGLQDLAIQGTADLHDVHLFGGALGPDQPQLDALHITFDGERTLHAGWRLNTFSLHSQPVRMEASGLYDHATVLFTAEGSFDLPVIAAQVPHLLALHEKTRIKEGSIDFSLDIRGDLQEVIFQSRCRAERISATYIDQPLVWESPLSLHIDGAYRQGKVLISDLQLYAPFFAAKGHGEQDLFSFQASADLDAMSAQLGQFFTLPWRGSGLLQLTGSLEAVGGDGYQFATRTFINDFALTREAVPLLPIHDFFLTLQGRLPSKLDREQLFTKLELESVSWPGTLALVLEGGQKWAGKRHTSLTARGSMDLARSTSILQSLGYDPAGISLEGDLSFTGSGSWHNRRLSLHNLSAVVEDLAVIEKKGLLHQEQQLTIEVEHRAPVGDKRVVLRELMVAEDWQDFIDVGPAAVWIDFLRRKLHVRHLHVQEEHTSALLALRVEDWREPMPLRDTVVEVRLHGTDDEPEADIEALQEAIRAQLADFFQGIPSEEKGRNEIEPGPEPEKAEQGATN
ncbi:hypothetical protein [Desulfobulbus alkaliphilus]|uniref:hypothetical protein n=1 Tax=Desulfobulbus alkaliphilus TaxID=869814 RepID=UPI001965C05B|nr:hypothetical protein [Desulfobulbus alkaliphilus]MBM9537865.1 hypothetical protein [Desulfobulbus alkaliphilus]